MHDATELALKPAEIAGSSNPDAYLTVMRYTDVVEPAGWIHRFL
jgi:hypothetical protein